MERNVKTYSIAAGQYEIIKKKMLKWCEPFSIFCFLDSNHSQAKYGSYECLLAVDVHHKLSFENGIEALSDYHSANKGWLFGHISYDYKNSLHNGLQTTNDCSVDFEKIFFFRPSIVLHVNNSRDVLTIETYGDADEVYNAICTIELEENKEQKPIKFASRTSKEQYISTVDQLRSHIKKGDCYEINYCNEFYAEHAEIDTLQTFTSLNELSQAPFAALYKLDDKCMMCASPERYLKKEGDRIISQPIKGTAPRKTNEEEDQLSKQELYNSIKERAENVMITDLVRNDLARSCEVGTVSVDELFGIYSFPQVHQMISTVSGELKEDSSFADAIKYSFPMGSMTGAPKHKVMQLIEEYEDVARGLFSGTVGYVTPEGDFDFNVIIRSLFYDKAKRMLTYQAGGAITYDSIPEKEWEEMRLKAWAMENVFKHNS